MPDEVEVTDLRPSKEVKDFHPFKPILDRLLLRRLAAKEDASGFEIPSKFREPEARGEVMTVGDGVTLGGAWHAMTEFVNGVNTVCVICFCGLTVMLTVLEVLGLKLESPR